MNITPTQAVQLLIKFFQDNNLKVPFESSFWQHDLTHAVAGFSTKLRDEIRVEILMTFLEGDEPSYEKAYASYESNAINNYRLDKWTFNKRIYNKMVEDCKAKVCLFTHIDDGWIDEFLELYEGVLTPYEEYIKD